MKKVLFLALCLLAIGCNDSKNPLSDPQTSKADKGLVGVWRETNGDTFYHIGHAGGDLPRGVMRVVEVTYKDGKLNQPVEYLMFPTVIGNKTYLNLVIDEKQVKRLDEKGWKNAAIESYTFLKYRLDGDKLTAWAMDEGAKKQAIQSGKIKGATTTTVAGFTDTTENIRRFIADADDRLWDTKNVGQFVRIVTMPQATGKHDEAKKQALAAAESWLALIDAGKYGESWDTAAEYLKNAVTKADFVKSLDAARKPLGKVKSREVASMEYRTSLPGAPDGQYVVIKFKSSLENKKSAIETVTPMLGKDQKWRVSGYYIK